MLWVMECCYSTYIAYIGQAWKHIKQEGGSEKKF